MAFRHGKAGVFKMGSQGTPTTLVDLSAFCEEIDFARKVDSPETTTFGSTSKTYVVGFIDNTFSVKGKFDAAFDAQISPLLGFDTPVSFEHGPEGSTTGRVKYTGSLYVSEYSINTPVKDVISFSMSLMVTGAVTRTTY